MAKTPEVKVKDEIRAALKTYGPRVWWYMPIGGMFATPGIPDFIGAADGRLFGIEAKAQRGTVTKTQANVHERMRLAGASVAIIKPSAIPIATQVAALVNPLLEAPCQLPRTPHKLSSTEPT